MSLRLVSDASSGSTPEVRYLDYLFRDAGIVELRHHVDGRWVTYWFDALEALLDKAEALSSAGNLYTSLNRPDFRGSPDGAVRDDDIARFTRLFFDFDPVRPKDCGSTDEELALAKVRAQELIKTLSAHGWPPPAIGMSGNGSHVQYRTAIPNTEEVRGQIRVIYSGLYHGFSDDVVEFDRSVKNPGRLCCLYGFTKRKGVPTAERPHRRASIVVPQDWRQVSQRQLEALANYYARTHRDEPPRTAHRAGGGVFTQQGHGDYRTLDVVSWAISHGAYRFQVNERVHSIWCPWQEEHSTEHGWTGAVILEADGRGWPNFHCHHQHCGGRGIVDLMALWGDADRFCSAKWDRGTRHV